MCRLDDRGNIFITGYPLGSERTYTESYNRKVKRRFKQKRDKFKIKSIQVKSRQDIVKLLRIIRMIKSFQKILIGMPTAFDMVKNGKH